MLASSRERKSEKNTKEMQAAPPANFFNPPAFNNLGRRAYEFVRNLPSDDQLFNRLFLNGPRIRAPYSTELKISPFMWDPNTSDNKKQQWRALARAAFANRRINNPYGDDQIDLHKSASMATFAMQGRIQKNAVNSIIGAPMNMIWGFMKRLVYAERQGESIYLPWSQQYRPHPIPDDPLGFLIRAIATIERIMNPRIARWRRGNQPAQAIPLPPGAQNMPVAGVLQAVTQHTRAVVGQFNNLVAAPPRPVLGRDVSPARPRRRPGGGGLGRGGSGVPPGLLAAARDAAGRFVRR